MKSILVVLVLFLVGRTTGADTSHKKHAIVTLNDSNFQQETTPNEEEGSSSSSWFILFKAKRCPHCQFIQPKFQELASDESLTNSIQFGQLDVPSNRDTTVRFKVRGFPTLLYLDYQTQMVYKYKGDRSASAMKEWLTKEDKGKGTPLPPPLTSFQTSIASLKAVAVELKGMAKGHQGIVGYGIVIIMSVILFLMMITFYFICDATIGYKFKTKNHKEKTH